MTLPEFPAPKLVRKDIDQMVEHKQILLGKVIQQEAEYSQKLERDGKLSDQKREIQGIYFYVLQACNY